MLPYCPVVLSAMVRTANAMMTRYQRSSSLRSASRTSPMMTRKYRLKFTPNRIMNVPVTTSM